ncbi:MAG: hypothetical protein HFJ59_02090 [Clostridia bacterium]|nr:hypothetical protein [Clostridia bacterium]
MKRTIKAIVMMTILTMVIGIVNISNAFSFNANLSSGNKLVAGQEVKVTLSISGINMDDGIRSIKIGKITVGEEFETITSSNFTSNTFAPTYSNEGLVLMSGTPIKSDGVAVTLTLKVKAGVTANSSTIKFENIVASSGSNTGDVSVGTKAITIKANAPAESGDGTGTTNPPTKPTTPNGTQNGTNSSTEKNTIKGTVSNTASKKELPKAGKAENTGIVLLILFITSVGMLNFIKYEITKKYTD